jgi:hypothetical protein
MRKLLACALAATLLGSWGTVVRAGDDDADDGDGKPAPRPFIRLHPVFAHMVHVDTSPPPQEKPAPKPTKPSTAKDSEPSKHATRIETPSARARSREEAALIRRLEVCDKLMEVAIRTNDRDLENRAFELEARAQAVYARNTASLSDRKDSSESGDKSRDLRKTSATSKDSFAGKLVKTEPQSKGSMGEENP